MTRALFKLMCCTLKIPATFVKAVFETPWKAHTCGQAYFIESDPKAPDGVVEDTAQEEITGLSMLISTFNLVSFFFFFFFF